MKRRDLLKRITQAAKQRGELLDITEGANHTKIRAGNRTSVIPRHQEINEITAKAILKQMGVQ